MRKAFLILPLALLLVMGATFIACSHNPTQPPSIGGEPLEQVGRDTIAALGGYISTAQTQYGPTCIGHSQASPVCGRITNAIAAQHGLADALAGYCSGPVANPATLTYAQGGACVPVMGVQQSLTAALTAGTAALADILSILNGGH